MPPAFYPFVIEIEHNGEYVEVMQDWQGNPMAYLYGTATRAEMLMSQAELDDMYETIDGEARHYEPDWSQRKRAVAEACRVEVPRASQQYAAFVGAWREYRRAAAENASAEMTAAE